MRGFNNKTPGQDGRRNIVRYDSPEFGGFVASASWGEDDLWDTSLTYKGEIHDFKLIGKIGYGESTDPTATSCGGPVGDFKCTWWGAAGTAMHAPTGLYLYAGYGQQKIESLPAGADDTSTTWFLQPGIERKWHPIGKTTIFGEYRKDDAGASVNAAGVSTTRGADLTFYAGGVVQNIEAASMDLYAIYRHAEGDYTNTGWRQREHRRVRHAHHWRTHPVLIVTHTHDRYERAALPRGGSFASASTRDALRPP